MAFKKLRGVDLPEEKQGLIRYTCLDWRSQPVWVQEKIRYICEQVAGAYQHALFEVMTTSRSITSDRKSTRLNSSHRSLSRMPSSA